MSQSNPDNGWGGTLVTFGWVFLVLRVVLWAESFVVVTAAAAILTLLVTIVAGFGESGDNTPDGRP
jgi:hypothetical protein